MITKSYSKTGRSCRVTFKIPPGQAEAKSIAVLGEFNGWNADAHLMEKRKDGSWSATVTMEAGRPYRFRYLLDGRHWSNEEGADSAVANQFGSEDSVVAVEVREPAAPVVAEKKAPAAKAAKAAGKTAKGNGRAAKKSAEPAPAPRKTAPARAAKTPRSAAKEK